MGKLHRIFRWFWRALVLHSGSAYGTSRILLENLNGILPSCEILCKWFHARGTISNGSVAGMDNKAKLAIKRLTALSRKKRSKLPYSISLRSFQSLSLRAESFDEAVFCPTIDRRDSLPRFIAILPFIAWQTPRLAQSRQG